MTNSGANNQTSPNIVLPKMIQYYMENIIRQDSIGINDTQIEEVVELSFWKMLEQMNITREAKVTFINSIASSNFVKTENNNGWNEIVGQIPNKCKSLTPAWKVIDTVKDIVICTNIDDCMFDNGNKEFLFDDINKQVLDFDNCVFDDVEQTQFDFNVLLLFYTDETGINKLHGINFIYPFEEKVTYWDMIKFTQKTNVNNTIGYQFKFNQKSCNNEATQIAVYAQDDHTHWNTFSQTIGKLNSFLEIKMRESSQINP
jgi:hypothetical protein